MLKTKAGKALLINKRPVVAVRSRYAAFIPVIFSFLICLVDMNLRSLFLFLSLCPACFCVGMKRNVTTVRS